MSLHSSGCRDFNRIRGDNDGCLPYPRQTPLAGVAEQNLDKMIKHQERMFGLEIKKEIAKSEHDMMMSTARTLGQSAEKA